MEDDFQVVLPQALLGNITVNKPALEDDMKSITICVWLQKNGSAVDIKYTTQSDGCEEITGLGILLNDSITITILGNEW